MPNQPKISRFEDIVAWQKASDLATELYFAVKDLRDYGFRDQLQRATISISSNIAEGYERRSNKELRQFLYIAKGSAAEVRSLLAIGKRLGYIKEETFASCSAEAENISKMLSGFIKIL